jgi:hypothetical protein
MQNDAIPIGSTVVFNGLVLTKIADDGVEVYLSPTWKSDRGDTFVLSDQAIRKFGCFKDLKVAE